MAVMMISAFNYQLHMQLLLSQKCVQGLSPALPLSLIQQNLSALSRHFKVVRRSSIIAISLLSNLHPSAPTCSWTCATDLHPGIGTAPAVQHTCMSHHHDDRNSVSNHCCSHPHFAYVMTSMAFQCCHGCKNRLAVRRAVRSNQTEVQITILGCRHGHR